jgi:DNA invertase Pin-like site-specific DNA recombinase
VKKIHVTLIQAATPRQIARKYGVNLSEVTRRLQKGVKIELEHTKNRQVAMKIAIDHLLEDLNYYSRVKL